MAAFHAGLAALAEKPELVAKVDADISMDEDYFERLVGAFREDGTLGIASGTCYEHDGQEWRQRFVTGASVWGAARVYRWRCLEQILPLEQRMGWDGIDIVKANVRGWSTRTFLDLPFRHHRVEAVRERSRWHAWALQGEASHYMGVSPLLRAGPDAPPDASRPGGAGDALELPGGDGEAFSDVPRPRCPPVRAELAAAPNATDAPERGERALTLRPVWTGSPRTCARARS